MDRKIWSNQETIKFITRYKENAILWNPKAVDYKNLAKKRKIQKKISDEFNTTVVEIARKIRILRAQWFKEYRKMNTLDGKKYKSHWKWFEPLKAVFDLNPTVMDDVDDSIIDENYIEDNEDDKYLHIRRESVFKDEESSEVAFMDGDWESFSNDEYQIFGYYVADELRSMHYQNNIQELKRLIKENIVLWKEKDDEEYEC